MMPLLHRPGAPLSAFVDCLWYFPAYVVEHQRERALPTGTVEVVFDLGENRMRFFKDDEDLVGERFHHSVICGPHSRYFVLDTSASSPVIGIHFRPGGSAPFLNLPAHELTDRHVALEDLWGPWAGEMRERLLHAPAPEQMLRLIEQLLLTRLRKPHLPHPAVVYAIQELAAFPQIARIRQVQTETGYSPKRFIELFVASVGLTPKVYSRIQRFQAVINRVAPGRHVDWASVALDGGYYDQPHLNREFRIFSGTTPALYQPVGKERPSHVAAR